MSVTQSHNLRWGGGGIHKLSLFLNRKLKSFPPFQWYSGAILATPGSLSVFFSSSISAVLIFSFLWQAGSGNLLVYLMSSTSKPSVTSSYAQRGTLILQGCHYHFQQSCHNMVGQMAPEQLMTYNSNAIIFTSNKYTAQSTDINPSLRGFRLS